MNKKSSGNIVHQQDCVISESLNYMTNTQMLVNRWLANFGFSED